MRVLNDAEILTELREAVAAGSLHLANLEGKEGSGNLQDRLANAAFRGLSFVARTLPRRLGYRIFARLSQLADLVPIIRRGLNERLSIAFPEVRRADLRHMRRQFWYQHGQTLFETLDYERFAADLIDKVQVEGREHVDAALAEGRPLVLIHNHQSNSEIMANILHVLVGTKLSGIYAPLAIPQLHRRILHRRTAQQFILYPRNLRGGMRLMAARLAEGYPMVITLDQRVPGIWHPFFGKPASSTIVPLVFAQRARARLLPIDLARLDNQGHFRLTFHPSLLPDEGADRIKPEALLTAYNTLLEGWIRERPADWFWLHDRWRSQA